MSYDSKSYDLADAFLAEFDATGKQIEELAQLIQDTVETYIIAKFPERPNA